MHNRVESNKNPIEKKEESKTPVEHRLNYRKNLPLPHKAEKTITLTNGDYLFCDTSYHNPSVSVWNPKTNKIKTNKLNYDQRFSYVFYDEKRNQVFLYSIVLGETLILSKNKEQDTNVYIDYNMYKDYKHSHILPRTRGYICPNKKCPTNGSKKVEKEAVFVRKSTDVLDTIFICTICDTVWKL